MMNWMIELNDFLSTPEEASLCLRKLVSKNIKLTLRVPKYIVFLILSLIQQDFHTGELN